MNQSELSVSYVGKDLDAARASEHEREHEIVELREYIHTFKV